MPADEYISGTVLHSQHVWEWGDVKRMIERMAQARSGYFLDVRGARGAGARNLGGSKRRTAEMGVPAVD